jgi:tRNA uridine 5-carbamoylmethylation protein Kti12
MVIEMSYYVIIRGPLGVGKTTVAKELAKRLKGEYISVDTILAESKLDKVPDGEDGISVKSFLKANEIAIPKAEAAMKKGKPVIFDGNFYYRKQMVNLVEKLGPNNFVFTLKAPLKTCVERDSVRKDKHGSQAAKVVYKLVTQFDYGTVVDLSKKSPEKAVEEIEEVLR